jgi:hypothetical protein
MPLLRPKLTVLAPPKRLTWQITQKILSFKNYKCTILRLNPGPKSILKGIVKRPGLIPGQLWEGGGERGREGGTGRNRGSVNLCFLRKAALTERDAETPRVSVRTGIAELGLLGRTDGCGRALRRRRVRRERTKRNSRGRAGVDFFFLSFENIGIILTCGERFLLIATKLYF